MFRSVKVGETIQFSFELDAYPAPSFQWLRNGFEVSGQTNRQLYLTDITTAMAGTYTCRITNLAGVTFFEELLLSVHS